MKDMDERIKDFNRLFVEKGKVFDNYVAEMSWPYDSLIRYLKGHSRHIDLQDIRFVSQMPCKVKLVFGSIPNAGGNGPIKAQPAWQVITG